MRCRESPIGSGETIGTMGEVSGMAVLRAGFGVAGARATVSASCATGGGNTRVEGRIVRRRASRYVASAWTCAVDWASQRADEWTKHLSRSTEIEHVERALDSRHVEPRHCSGVDEWSGGSEARNDTRTDRA